MNILEPLCMDKRTKEHNQSYVIMYLCLKGQMNILEPLCMDRRTKEQTQTYVIMDLCVKEQKNISYLMSLKTIKQFIMIVDCPQFCIFALFGKFETKSFALIC